MRNKLYIIILLILVCTGEAFSCRFTVREIGFSTLSRDNYSLVYINDESNFKKLPYSYLKDLLVDSNIGLLFLDPKIDNSHPAIVAARKDGLKSPGILLLSPDGKILLFEEKDLRTIIKEISSSPLTEIFIRNNHETFAYVILLVSHNQEKNRLAGEILNKACEDISDRMPNMPKQVKNGPSVLTINRDDFENEKVILWSLGIDKIPESPLAFVIYGRGRIIGDLINYEGITGNTAFQYLAMIGADCECGLDRKWMLGRQIPMNWPEKARQELTDELGFDVDNPMILAEMSYIMSKDPVEGAGSDLTFAPAQLDLDDLYQSDKSSAMASPKQEKKRINPLLIIILISALVIIVGTSILIIRKKKS